MPAVISASRRTDIPAFYANWFAQRLRAGYVFVKNPFSQKLFRVSLKPEDVSAIVFWSKNYAPLLNKLDVVEKTTKNIFFHFTITANKELEPHVPDYQDTIKDFLYLSLRYSPEHIVWRFDPICITDKLSFEVHEERFTRCAELLKGHAKRCIISFVHPYKKVLTNLRKYTDHALLELSLEKKREYAEALSDRAKAYGINLYACCNDYLQSENILKASCIDGRQLANILKSPIDTRPAATRKECACTKSLDIGAYDTCAHGCVYCYANTNCEKAYAAPSRQNLDWNSLGMHADEEERTGVDAQQELL
jgi:DNA repair photolyase